MSHLEAVSHILQTAITDQVFPGSSIAYLKDSQVSYFSLGRLTYAPDAALVRPETLYDVASVTKSIPTNTLILYLADHKKLSLDDPISIYLPDWPEDVVTIRHLLTYTAVFDLPLGLSEYARDGNDCVEVVMNAHLRAAPGSAYSYTNAQALLLGLIAEQAGKKSLDQLAQDIFFQPLGMQRTTFFPKTFSQNEVAPSEIDGWRGEVWQEVNDESAWAMRQTGQVAGQAGLFSTAPDLLIFLQMLLASGTWQGRRYLRPATVAQMSKNQIPRLSERTGLGWELLGPTIIGTATGMRIFGKTGYTGCLVAADPDKNNAVVLLTNRNHPTRQDPGPINAVRRAVSEIVFGN